MQTNIKNILNFPIIFTPSYTVKWNIYAELSFIAGLLMIVLAINNSNFIVSIWDWCILLTSLLLMFVFMFLYIVNLKFYSVKLDKNKLSYAQWPKQKDWQEIMWIDINVFQPMENRTKGKLVSQWVLLKYNNSKKSKNKKKKKHILIIRIV